MKTLYTRVLIKLSGEALSACGGGGLDGMHIQQCADELASLYRLGLQVGVVIGGGNLWRGARGKGKEIPRTDSDAIGMMATVMNALALKSALQQRSIPVLHQSALSIPGISQGLDADLAIAHLEKGGFVLFSGGTGQPFFSTDTASALRAAQIKAEVILKATQVDGVYDQDPVQFPNAKCIKHITFTDAIQKQLHIMDMTAFDICNEANLSIRIFKNEPGALFQAITDPSFGSTVSHKKT